MGRPNAAGDDAERNESDVNLWRVEPEDSADRPKPILDVIFIHGLGGHHEVTWRNSEKEMTWPQRVANAHRDAQVWSLRYPANIGAVVSLGEVDQPGIRGLALLAAARMRDNRIGERPAVFVCHSLGGLLAKRILLDARGQDPASRDRFLHEGVHAVMFCGTPHRGSALANVLKGAEWVKNIAPGALMVGLGLDGARYAGWVAKCAFRTSQLIDELERNDIGLQHLNEDFRAYYESRAGTDFIVRVYAEAKGMRLGIFRTLMVVPSESADPNLRVGTWPKVQVLPVTDKDHSELVKPTSDIDWVVEGLDALIRQVAENDFDLGVEAHWPRRIGMLIHAELFKCQDLLDLSCFRRISKGMPPSAAEHLYAARQLATSEGEAVLDLLAEIGRSVGEIPKNHGRFDDLCDALSRIGSILLMAYLREDVDRPAGVGEVLKIDVPALDRDEQRLLMAEILHASLRNWPAKFQVKEGRLLPGSWILGSSGQAPGSWRDEDHLNHLANRILDPVMVRKPPHALAGHDRTQWPKRAKSVGGVADEDRLQDARDRLGALLRYQMGVVLDAHGADSPYSAPEMRDRLGRAFGELITLMLPVQGDAVDLKKRRMLGKAYQNVQVFLVNVQNARRKAS
ncbi:hypothetical protein [Lysobacter hankyongensis]|uniref:DUF676 domain-containing protein n=1 Tax=Lysobacter hankyongensis TaxID=1176535 RepID=A0ABP9C4J3_9GAMM